MGIYSDNAVLTITGLSIKKPTYYGLVIGERATVQVYGSSFEATFFAILMIDRGNFLKMRGSVLQSEDYSIAVTSDFLGVDLGISNADPGRNTIVRGLIGLSVITKYLSAARTVYAVGNQWKPKVQGADASGLYSGLLPPRCFASKEFGGNFRVSLKPGDPQLCLAL